MGICNYTRRDFLKTTAVGTASLALPGCVNGPEHVNSPSKSTPIVSNRQILHQMDFAGPKDGWKWPEKLEPRFIQSRDGLLLRAAETGQLVGISGNGVHTRNGDSIELHFTVPDSSPGILTFGFLAESEKAQVRLDFKNNRISFLASDWRIRQPVVNTALPWHKKDVHTVLIEKNEGPGRLVKNADFSIYLDGEKLIEPRNQNVLPEMGVYIAAEDADILVRRFVHRGTPSGIPEYLHIGGWQMINIPDLPGNLDSICRGLAESAERGIQLLVTPETSLTGLFPEDPVTQNPQPVAEAEKKLRHFIRNLRNAPYVIVGLPIWKESGDGGRARYNASRLYSPDGEIVGTFCKIHSCEPNFWHGYRLNEFDIHGVPVCMHICHDGRYPETWTLPVMFGARLVVHPNNPVSNQVRSRPAGPFHCVTTSVPEVEKGAVGSSHAFYLGIGGGGGTIASPQQYRPSTVEYHKWISQRNETYESLCHKNIRVHDAFGYWPTRSFRASERVAEAYLSLYRAMGGTRS